MFSLWKDALLGGVVQQLELVVLLCGSSEFAVDTITVISHQLSGRAAQIKCPVGQTDTSWSYLVSDLDDF